MLVWLQTGTTSPVDPRTMVSTSTTRNQTSALYLLFILNTYFGALKTEHNLLGGLGLLVEDGLGLSSETHLLRVITSLALSKVGGLSGLIRWGPLEGPL